MTTDITPDEKRKAARLLRQAAGMTQLEVAQKAKISRPKLSLYETGLVDLTADELRRVEKVLHRAQRPPVTLASLLKAEVPKQEKQKPADEKTQRKFRRQQAGISQRALALASKIPRNKLIEFEAGRIPLNAGELARWETVLNEAAKAKMLADPYFKLEVAHSAGKGLWESYTKLKEEYRIYRETSEKLIQNQHRLNQINEEIIAAYKQHHDEVVGLEKQVATLNKSNTQLRDLLDLKTKEVLLREKIESEVEASEAPQASKVSIKE